jgi:uncharacterized protein
MDEKSIQKIIDVIIQKFDPEKVILFGSYAWGKPEKDSDVDLLIVKDDPKKNTREMAVDLERILSQRDIPLDLLVYKPNQMEDRIKINDPFIVKIYRDGKVLYEQ